MEDTNYRPKKYVELNHPDWSKNAVIYEVNIRQYSKEGTFASFEKHLARLKELGIDILWLMPIHPIGLKNRKGSLGSYYSVQDYYGVNPEFGALNDLKNLVKKIHDMGMYVILDWVANHSAWDNKLTEEHSEWYSKTGQGDFQPTRWWDWYDVIDFDYNQPGIRKYMTEAMKFWIEEMDIDGYRCDVAGFVPLDFWENVRHELEKIKPVFMLAEWESRDLHKKAFDMTYGWTFWSKMRDVCTRKRTLSELLHYIADLENSFPPDAIKMNFIDNHDKNSWEGTPFTNFGAGLEASMVLAATVPGMPLVYSGQEAGMNKSLSFWDRDPIDWKKHPFTELYKKLFSLKHRNQALWNGLAGGPMDAIVHDKPHQVLAFYREKGNAKVVVLINYSSKAVNSNFQLTAHVGMYKELFSDQIIRLSDSVTFSFKAWEYSVLEKIG